MQELSIHHAIHFSKYDKACLVQFYPSGNLILHNHYTSENQARQMIDQYSIGIWKIKKITDKN